MLDIFFNRLLVADLRERRTRLLAMLDEMGAQVHTAQEKVGKKKPFNIRVPLHDGTTPYVVIGAHYDSVPGSSGANDNAAGVAVALGMLRVFQFVQKQKRRTLPLEFVFFDMGQANMLGSQAYVRHIDPAQIYAMLNLNLCGMGDVVLLSPGDHVRDSEVERALRRLNDSPHKASLRQVELLPPGDDAPFNARGIPTVSICIVPEDDIVLMVGLAVALHNNEKIALLPAVYETIHNRTLDKPESVDIDAMRQVMLVANTLITNLFLTMPAEVGWR